MDMVLIIKAMRLLGKGTFTGISGDEYSGITWVSEPTFSKEEFDTKVAELQEEYDNDYARNRQAEYPSIVELTVALYDTDDKSAIETKRAAVKLKFPKP